MKRVPAATAALEKKQGWGERLDAAVERLRERGLAVDEEIHGRTALARWDGPTEAKRDGQGPTCQQPADPHSARGGNYRGRRRSFVISSHPIAGIRTGLQLGESRASEMWLPIVSEVAVRVAFGGELRTVALTRDRVASINRDSCAQGDFLAGASKDLVESVT
jgi:hypothetical protein